jgi:hypothetical protein
MANPWRFFDTNIGCLDRLMSGGLFLLLTVVWMVMAGVAYDYGEESWSLRRDGSSIGGVVVALKESADSDGVTYAPIIKYVVEGQTHTFESDNSSSPPAYEVGERVVLLYDSADPSQARIDSWWELWLMPVMLGGAGLILAVVINAMIVVSFLRSRAARNNPE